VDIPLGDKDLLGRDKPTLDQPLGNRRPEISAADDRDLLIHKIAGNTVRQNTAFPAIV
jgi:hypothetical protein